MDRDETHPKGAGQEAVRAGRLLFHADDLVGKFAADRIDMGPIPEWGSFRAIGVLSQDCSQLIAGVVYNNYTGTNITQSIAADTPAWCTRQVLKGLFYYPFITLGCTRATALVDEANLSSKSLATRLGFTQEGALRKDVDGERDRLIFGLLKEECKWLQ